MFALRECGALSCGASGTPPPTAGAPVERFVGWAVCGALCAVRQKRDAGGVSFAIYTSTDHWVSPQKAQMQLAASNSFVPIP